MDTETRWMRWSDTEIVVIHPDFGPIIVDLDKLVRNVDGFLRKVEIVESKSLG